MNIINEKPYTENRLSYEECRVEAHPGLPEYDSRGRRLRKFKTETGLIEELRRPSPEHNRILQTIKHKTEGRLDHISFWWVYLGKGVRKAVVLIEPYNETLRNYRHPSLVVIQVPPKIAPYGGGCLIDKHGKRQPGTNSFLIMSNINKSILLSIETKLIEAESKMPEWDAVR